MGGNTGSEPLKKFPHGRNTCVTTGRKRLTDHIESHTDEEQDAYRPGFEAEADEQKDLGHQDGKGQVSMDVIALVPDGAHRPKHTHTL